MVLMHVRPTAATGTYGSKNPMRIEADIPYPSRLTDLVELTPLATQQGCTQPLHFAAERG